MLKRASLIEININKEIDAEFFNKNIITDNINNLNINALYNQYNCSSVIWNSVDNDSNIITDLLAPYEGSHMEEFEYNIVDCEKNANVDIKNQPPSFNLLIDLSKMYLFMSTDVAHILISLLFMILFVYLKLQSKAIFRRRHGDYSGNKVYYSRSKLNCKLVYND